MNDSTKRLLLAVVVIACIMLFLIAFWFLGYFGRSVDLPQIDTIIDRTRTSVYRTNTAVSKALTATNEALKAQRQTTTTASPLP